MVGCIALDVFVFFCILSHHFQVNFQSSDLFVLNVFLTAHGVLSNLCYGISFNRFYGFGFFLYLLSIYTGSSVMNQASQACKKEQEKALGSYFLGVSKYNTNGILLWGKKKSYFKDLGYRRPKYRLLSARLLVSDVFEKTLLLT